MAKKRAKGEGTIYQVQNTGRWVAQLRLPNGDRISKSSLYQKDVIDWLTDQRTKLREGRSSPRENLKLGAFLDQYMEDVASLSLRPSTLLAYGNLIKHHIKPALGNTRVTSLTPNQVQTFYSDLRKKGLSRRTVQYVHAVLHRALNQAVRWGMIYSNVTDLVDAPKPKRKPFKTWTTSELRLFLKAVEDHQWYAIYVIAAYCGLRQGEILGLHRGDIDLDKGIIQVKHQLTYVRGQGMLITEPKTRKSKRPVTLPPSALEILKKYLKYFKNDGLIFTTRSGKPISPRNIVRHFKKVIEKEGLTDIRFHDLRHTHATLLLEAGVHPKVVQERLGHSQISLTLDTYSHVIPSLQTEAADQFEALLQ